MEFDENDKFNKEFESDIFKIFDIHQSSEVTEERVRMETKVRSKGNKPKDSELRYVVREIFYFNNTTIPHKSEFKERGEANNFFESEKEKFEIFAERSKKNEVFDGRRYFWKIDDNDNIIEKVIP